NPNVQYLGSTFRSFEFRILILFRISRFGVRISDFRLEVMSHPTFDQLDCPLPRTTFEHVSLGHGSGGRLSADLIRRLFLPAFDNPVLAALEDQATVALPGGDGQRIAFTTDSFVVRPIFFPGGDIGSLAVHGTVNDLAVGGATPLFLSAAFILEEGLAI